MKGHNDFWYDVADLDLGPAQQVKLLDPISLRKYA